MLATTAKIANAGAVADLGAAVATVKIVAVKIMVAASFRS
jgi:hypothetical protein